MPGPNDTSATERIRQLKCRILASTISKGNFKANDYQTWLDIKIGREGRVIQPASGAPAFAEAGCCDCSPVCDLSGEVQFIIGNIDEIPFLQFQIELVTGVAVSIPPPPSGYTNPLFGFCVAGNACNETNGTVTVYDLTNTVVPITQHYLGFFPNIQGPPPNTFSFVITYFPNDFDPFADISGATYTSSNACSSVSDIAILGCFLPGTPVALADGSTKPIEAVAVGDMVVGAFGEHNPVLALHQPMLGGGKLCRINGDHTTTTHHPHIGSDRGFYCPNPAALNSMTYGQNHTVILGDGTREKRTMTGVRKDRILTLAEGVQLQTVSGSRTVSTIEPVQMSPFTKVYHLVVGGSHTYTVDGYAVVGWAREDDFDYDAWIPK